MVNIEVRQNGEFELGYPYNSTVDNYFQSLSTDFISNYGLDTTTVNAINDHKNDTLQFDRDIHEFLIKLSAFMVGFEQVGQVIIDEFEALLVTRNELEQRQYELETNKSEAVSEYEFVSTNIEQINADIQKLEELIVYYGSQIVDDTYVYSDTYIDDTTTRLSIIGDIITQNEADADHYIATLSTQADSLVVVKTDLIQYDFKQTSLRALYEAWRLRPEEYYQALTSYYKDEYESTWVYGTSLMYGEKLEEETALTNIYNTVAAKVQETLFKRYNFIIEQDLKEYSLLWLQTHATFEEYDFILATETKRQELLEREIVNVENIINDKYAAVRSVVSLTQENNYYKYRELVQEKRKYVFMNILSDTIDQAMLDNYDSQLEDLESDYQYVEAKFSQKTYMLYYSDLERHQELLIDLRRQLEKTIMAISREFQKDATSNAEFIEKIDFYNAEKADLEEKIDSLTSMKDKLEIDNNVYSDELTLLESKIFENTTFIEEKRAQYIAYFDERIPFFTQDVAVSENDGIVELLNGNFYRDFDDRYQEFLSYSSNVQWYDVDSRESLKTLYSNILTIINSNMKLEWEREFGHKILDGRKITIYEYYFDKEIRTLYATINKHLLDEHYSAEFIDDIKTQTENIKNIFKTYTDIAFEVKTSITAMLNVFDYDDVFTFDIANGNETVENVIETFNSVLDGIVTFAYNKNIEYKINEETLDNKEKIDQIWLDMEKNYV